MKRFLLAISFVAVLLAGCTKDEAEEVTETAAAEEQKEEKVIVKDNITLSEKRGEIGTNITFTVDELEPDSDVQLIWLKYDGKYLIEDLYVVKGAEYTESELVIAEGKADANGEFTGQFEVPDTFGANNTIQVKQNNTVVGQTNFNVWPTFELEPKSGPPGTEITIKVKGIGWSTYNRNWQVTYDNHYTGILTAVSTNGTAHGKIRATGKPGDHYISVRTGYLGSPYINFQQSPHADKPKPDLVFTITDEPAVNTENYVEPIPKAAGGGVEMPKPENKKGVDVKLSVEEGIVGAPVTLTATGLPANESIDLIWNTMVGSRVSGLGFEGTNSTLTALKTDANGNLNYDFTVPDDLGGIPHRIDLKVGDEIYGQTYLRILPSIVDFSPKSGPAGTPVTVTIKGGGWTEFDNAYYMTYDNSHMGYMCSFNSQGTLIFEFIATGDKGFHYIDLYPGIYRWAQEDTDPALIPQLTYAEDHPGSAMPAIRMAFEITE